MASKFALIIANTEYSDPGLAQLIAPGMDAKEFGRVLDSPELAAFDDVIILFNENAAKVNEIIDYFFSARKPDDLLLLYFSGHGVRDEYGSLYLAVKNTNRARLRSTGIKSDFIREAMDQSRSKRQVLILDCCNSGAFAQGTKAEIGGSIGTAKAFEGTGYGRIVLTASDSTQFAWEGDKVIGQDTSNSLFTHFLVKGLEGEADRNGDGKITIDELYDYAYEQVIQQTPKQTPGKWSYKQQGDIMLRENLKPREVRPTPLPSDLQELLAHSSSSVRRMGVQELISLLDGKHLGLVRAAQDKLLELAKNDDSLALRSTAYEILTAHGVELEKPPPVEILKEEPSKAEKIEKTPSVLLPDVSEQKNVAPDTSTVPMRRLRLVSGIIGGLLIFGLLVWGGSRLFSNPPAVTPEPTQTLEANVNLISQASATSTSQPAPSMTPASTDTPVPAAPTLGIGSSMIGKDQMILLYVPAGKFTMGSDTDSDDEKPAHLVDLAAFWIDQTEVTNGMYRQCVDEGECQEPGTKDSAKNYGYYQGLAYSNFPVMYVDWNMAQAYCGWAGRRLPTEAEWEKAARGEDRRIYPWGNEAPNANLLNFAYPGSTGDTSPVKSYEAGKSLYGAYDMAGNVWEWVSSLYKPYPYDPADGREDPSSTEERVQRGGSWLEDTTWLRSSKRDKGRISYVGNNLGFRCAMSAAP